MLYEDKKKQFTGQKIYYTVAHFTKHTFCTYLNVENLKHFKLRLL